ncbi:MAG: ClpXP protease specificity-enhancing factor [Arenicellales bacterium]|jgi:stringent starvation protein B|nr:ClpXP protease specificity-enhancing factor [Arenicellales bacterium]
MVVSTKPYLIRAIYEWAMENGFTPQILVDAQVSGVDVPEGYVNEGKIVLNIQNQAVQHLELGNELISFSARFGGVPVQLAVPVDAVLAIYTRENGDGLSFVSKDPNVETEGEESQEESREESREESPESDSGDDGGPDTDGSGPKRGSHLKLVK